MGADDVLGRYIDEVPVVDVGDLIQIEPVDRFARAEVAPPVLLHEDQESEEPLFVPSRSEE
jgi:hypothetical protein